MATSALPAARSGTDAGLVAFVGRILIAAIFVLSGLSKLTAPAATIGYIQSAGLPAPSIAYGVALLVELGGGILLIIGWKTRWVALAFFLWLIPTTLIFHKFWGIDAAQVQNQFNNFMKNISIMGAMWMLMGFGPGAYSVDKR